MTHPYEEVYDKLNETDKIRYSVMMIISGSNNPDIIKLGYDRIMEVFSSIIDERDKYKKVVDSLGSLINAYNETL